MGASNSNPDSTRVQLNVTLPRETLEELRSVYSVALEDSERVRQSIADALEHQSAEEITIKRSDT